MTNSLTTYTSNKDNKASLSKKNNHLTELSTCMKNYITTKTSNSSSKTNFKFIQVRALVSHKCSLLMMSKSTKVALFNA